MTLANNTEGLEQILDMINGLDAPEPKVEQATPTIEVSSDGLIASTATQEAGRVSAGTKTATKQLDVQKAQTITPGTSNQVIAGGKYLTGEQTIEGDSDLVAGNIKSGVNIFNVAGTFTSDATATAEDVISGETAYVNGLLITGTNPYEKTATDSEVASQADLMAQIQTALANKSGSGGEQPNFGYVLDFGEFTLTANTLMSDYAIETSLAKVFSAHVWCPGLLNDQNDVSVKAGIGGIFAGIDGGNYAGWSRCSCAQTKSNTGVMSSISGSHLSDALDNTFKINDNTSYYIAGKKYYWIAWGN